jgi:hypothetical protein
VAFLNKWHEDICATHSGTLGRGSRQFHRATNARAVPFLHTATKLHSVDPLQQFDEIATRFWYS